MILRLIGEYSSECRFPHVLPEANGFAPPNRIGPKPRYPLNGVTNLENNVARMNLNEVSTEYNPTVSFAHQILGRKHCPYESQH